MENKSIPTPLYDRVRHIILHEWDPIGIQGYKDWPQDEYDAYVPDVCQLLMRGASFEEVFSYMWWLETQHMGLPGERGRTEGFAKQLAMIGQELQCRGQAGG
jgi:hypothetical protein